jgi:streptomycin 6-kinase
VSPSVDVPELVRTRALSNGAAGQRWLDELPELVADLASRWGLTLGRSHRGGTAGLVVDATDADLRACVLKVVMRLDVHEDESFRRSVTAHRLDGGRACAELYASDASVPALLLERLGPNLDQLALPLPAMLDAIAATLRSFWRPVPADCDLPTGDEAAAWLAEHIVSWWGELGRPCGREVIDRAVDFCAQRAAAFDPDDAVLVHGDAHGWNTLDAGGGRYKFVDPDGLRSERAHDLSVPMREYNVPLLAGDTQRLVRERAETLAGACGVDPEPVWQWGFVERVSTGLVNIRELGGGEGMDFLEVATRCL